MQKQTKSPKSVTQKPITLEKNETIQAIKTSEINNNANKGTLNVISYFFFLFKRMI